VAEQSAALDGIDIQLVTLDETNNKASRDSEAGLKELDLERYQSLFYKL
jgi:hypothetical protein